MEKSAEFHEKREAQIRSIYNADEIEYRILNGDGGSWIKDPYEPETVFQLDRFHIRQEIKRKLNGDKEAMNAAEGLFGAEKMDEMLEYIRIYADSVESDDEKDTRAKKARELYQYLSNNREGLMPYRKRNLKLPEGMEYGNMGVQENQNCTVSTTRMREIIITLSAVKAPKRDEKGNLYVDVINIHIPLKDAVQTVSRRTFAKALL